MPIRLKRWIPRLGLIVGGSALFLTGLVLIAGVAHLDSDPVMSGVGKSIVRASHELYTLDWDRSTNAVVTRGY